MLLKNLMEDKPLNFNQPILSVRRIPSTLTKGKDEKRKSADSLPSVPPIPSYKSDLKSGPMRTPGTVPFVWEQTPGMPKAQKEAIERPLIAPKLPPGRTLKVNKQTPDKIHEDPIVYENQATKVTRSMQSNSSSNESIVKFDSPKAAVEECSDSGDCDEEYTDALDTLSRTESFYGNCSLSGLSGIEGPNRKPSGTFSTDPQTRDFMMGRFLPAAKAMASETPPYSSRKQHVQREQPMQWEQPKQAKLAGVDKKPPLSHHRPVVLTNYAKDDREEESDGFDDDFDESRILAPKVCGLLPRFCLKSSFCLLNPVPGMSMRTRSPISHASKTRARSSSSSSCSGSENEQTRVASYEQKATHVTQTTEVCEDKSNLKNEMNRGFQQKNSQKLDGSSLYRRLQGNDVPPQKIELHQPAFFEEKGGVPEEAKKDGTNDSNSSKKAPFSFRELMAFENAEAEAGLPSSMVEKTLYIDSVPKESSNSNLPSPDTNWTSKTRENDYKTETKIKAIEETAIDSSVDVKNSHELGPEIPMPSFDKSDQEVKIRILKGFGRGRDLDHDSINGSLNSEDQQIRKAENEDNYHESYSELPLPPPLPTSPSESWLWRTLPSMSSRGPSRMYHGTGVNLKTQAAKTAATNPKWETIVRTTKDQRQHTRFSEEQLAPIPET